MKKLSHIFFVKIPFLVKFWFFSGILDKKKGLFNRRRMFLLTEGPHLYYVDSSAMVLKGEIPWNSVLKTEIRDFRIFFVHVPGRIYYLIDQESTSKDWCAAIDEVKQYYFGNDADQIADDGVSSTTWRKKLVKLNGEAL